MQPKKTFLLQPEWAAALLLTAVIVALHFYFWLHVGGLWRDEVNSVNLAGSHSLAAMEKDSFPLLMPLSLHIWIALGLGNSDLHLRLFGLLVGLGILAALWGSGWKIRRAPPLLGLVLLGLNSTLIFFGDSLRAYGLGSLLALVLTASAFLFLQRPSVSRAVWLALFAVLSVQVLYHNAVLVAAVCCGAWAVCWRRKDGRGALQILLVAVLSAASLLPYTHNLVAGAHASEVLRTGIEFPRFFSSFNDTFGYPVSGYYCVWALFYVAIVFSACARLLRKSETPSEAGVPCSKGDLCLFAAVMLTLAVVGFPIFFWCSQMPMESWYLLPFMASAVVCLDAVRPPRQGISRALLVVFVLVTVCFSLPKTDAQLKQHFSDIDLYAEQLTQKAEPKDYILVWPWHYGLTFNYYFKGATPWDTLPPLSDHSVHRFDLVQLQIQNTNAIAPVLRQITQTLQSGHHVWILAAHDWMGIPGPGMTPPASLPPPPLKDTGWADWPYTHVWAAQIACFLSDHSTQFGKLKSLSSERFIAEDMDAFVASGWNTNSPVR